MFTDTTAYNASPVAGFFFSVKYTSGGASAGVGGVSMSKKNATDGDLGSYMSFHTRPTGGANTERLRISDDGIVTALNPVGGIGYGTGAGGAVTQITNKSTGVTLNKVSGQITMQAAALAAAAKVSFVVTNSTVSSSDVVIVSVASGGTANAYRAAVTATAAGSFTVTIENVTAGSLSETPVINFAVLKAVNA